MVQVSYPGVYVQEKASGDKTITGVATSVAAFFGRATKGYLNRPVRCLSVSDFVRAFGSPHPQSDLAASVAQFYANGGTDCYVVRLASSTARRAEVTLRNWGGTAVLRARAKVEGLGGNGVRVLVDYNTPNPGETLNLRVIQEEGGREVASETFTNLSMDPASARFATTFVTQGSQLIDLELAAGFNPNTGSFSGFSEGRAALGDNDTVVPTTINNLRNPASGARRHSFEISVDGSAYTLVNLSTMTAVPATAALIATELGTRINAALGGLVPARQVTVAITQVAAAANQHFLRMTANTAGADQGVVRIRRAAGHDIAAAVILRA